MINHPHCSSEFQKGYDWAVITTNSVMTQEQVDRLTHHQEVLLFAAWEYADTHPEFRDFILKKYNEETGGSWQ